MIPKTLPTVFLLFLCAEAYAQPGTLIKSFGEQGIVVTTSEGTFNRVGVQSNGKVIVSNGHVLFRYNTDGTKDLTFGTTIGGGANIGSFAVDMIIQRDDDKIVTVGSNVIRRFSANGILDASFDGDGSVTVESLGITYSLKDLEIDYSDKVVACGQATWGSGSDEVNTTTVVRLNPDGSLDNTFNNVGIRNYVYGDGIDRSAARCAVAPDNKIALRVVASSSIQNAIFRYNANGTTDTQFGSNGNVFIERLSLMIKTDASGNVLYLQNGVPGTAANLYHSIAPKLGRLLHTNGAQDFGFTNGMNTSFLEFDFSQIAMQSTGKTIVVGRRDLGVSQTWRIFISRFNQDGSLDENFGTSGKTVVDLNFPSGFSDVAVYQRKIFAAGFLNVDSGPSSGNYGVLAAFDGSDARMTCPNPLSQYSVDTGKCYATVNNINAVFNTTTLYANVKYKLEFDNGTVEEGEGGVSGKQFQKGTTNVTYSYTDITEQTCSFAVVVKDTEPPSITLCPAPLTVSADPGQCYATITVNTSDIVATDNCAGAVTVIAPTMPVDNHFSKGTTTLVWTVKDSEGNTSTCQQIVTVVDEEAPIISNVSLSTNVLTPPDRKMKDVTVNYSLNDNCGEASAVLSVSSDEPESGINNADLSPDWEIIDSSHLRLRAERDPKGDGRVFTITITATDDSGNVSTQTATVLVSHDIVAPPRGKPFKAGSPVTLAGVFWDIPGKTHSAKWLIDGKTSVKGTVTEPSGMKNGTVTGSYKFDSPGVYKLHMNITDQSGVTTSVNTNGDLEAFVVVYDPNGGYTYGDGSFYSRAGALMSDPTISGDVSYGFTVNYYKGSTYPKGEIQLNFLSGEFEFNAVNLEYLVIGKAMAQFKGMGKITGGQSGVAFVMTIVDGQLDGSGADKVRMKIYNKNTGQVYYDNQPGASETDLPITVVSNSSTIVISPNNVRLAGVFSEEVAVSQFDVIISPNPSDADFGLDVVAEDHAPADVRVVNCLGNVIESHRTSEKTLRLGGEWQAGMYIVDVMQGSRRKTIKLIKY